ncbi:MAG: hypothetical protein IJG88_00965 [Eggerthellaceae bacterium]|nr:hypothetical protein [Eggerthellaceae bacterium]
MKVEWGIRDRKAHTGMQLAVAVFQVASLLPLAFLFGIVGYPAIVTMDNPLALLFKLGMAAIPRIEALGLSHLYHLTGNEVAIHFALLISALVAGVLVPRIARSSDAAAVGTRRALAAFCAFDIAMSLLPRPCTAAFGIGAAAAGIAAKLACLVFIALDLKAAKGA